MFIDRTDLKLEITPLPKTIMSALEYLMAVFTISARVSAEWSNRRLHNSALAFASATPTTGRSGRRHGGRDDNHAAHQGMTWMPAHPVNLCNTDGRDPANRILGVLSALTRPRPLVRSFVLEFLHGFRKPCC